MKLDKEKNTKNKMKGWQRIAQLMLQKNLLTHIQKKNAISKAFWKRIK